MNHLKKFISSHLNFITSLIYAASMTLISISLSIFMGDVVSFAFVFFIILELIFILYKSFEVNELYKEEDTEK